MARLIDADALKASLEITGTAESCKGCKHESREWSCCADDIPTNYVCEQIDEAPTVEAIPIEWLKEHIVTIEQEWILEDWEREHEID